MDDVPPMTTHDQNQKTHSQGAATIRELQLLSPQLLRCEPRNKGRRQWGMGWDRFIDPPG